MKRIIAAPWTVGLGLGLLALAYRLLLLHTSLATVDADQAVFGLMARHILHGERPIFFYGQSYQGALEAYLTALVFRLGGASDLTLRLVPTLVSALVVLQLYLLARRLYGAGVALASGLWLALPAPVLASWGTVAGAGYIEVVALGSGLLTVAVRRWGLGEARGYDLAVLGLLAGLGVWVQPMIAFYLATLALLAVPVLWRRVRSWQWSATPATIARRVTPMTAMFVVGAAPWLGYTLRHHGSLAMLDAHALPWSLPDVVKRLALETGPVLSGGANPTGYADQFGTYVSAHPWPYGLALLALCYLAVRLVVSPHGLIAQGRALLRGWPRPDAALAILLVAVLALYFGSRYKTLAWTTRNPRYLLPLYTSLPYLVACALPTGRATLRLAGSGRPRRRGIAAACLILALGINVYTMAHFLTLPSSRLPSVTPLVTRLLARGDTAVYADYWVVWRLAFDSGERLAPVATLGLAVDYNPRGDRYPPEHGRAARARRWAYIVPDRLVPALVHLLRRHHIPYVLWGWGTRDLFYNHWDWGRPTIVDGPVRPGLAPILFHAAT